MTFAPIDAEYLTLASNGVLTDYRILTLGSMLVAVDGGAAGPYTLNVDPAAVPHNSLDQLATGNPHTQYMLGTILSANGDLLTRVAGSPAALAVGSNGDVLTVSSGAPAWAAPASAYSLLDSQPQVLTIVNTNATQTLYTYTIPANTLASGDLLRLRLFNDYLNDSGGVRTFTLTVSLGGTTLYQDTSGSQSAVATRRSWYWEFLFAIRDASPNVRFQGFMRHATGTAPTTGISALLADLFNYTPEGDADATLSGSLTLLVQFQHAAANANLEIRRRGATLEHIPA